MNSGKKFEVQFKNSVPENVVFYRLKDQFKGDFNNENGYRFTPKNEFDAFLFDSNRLFILELKSTKENSLSIGDKKMIKTHQIKSLYKFSKYKNCISGFIINFREKDSEHTYFVDINKFIDKHNSSGKQSINKKDIQSIGIEIESIKLRSNFKYNIESFLNNFES